jgi:hypothetical protein
MCVGCHGKKQKSLDMIRNGRGLEISIGALALHDELVKGTEIGACLLGNTLRVGMGVNIENGEVFHKITSWIGN